jgi:hypothetical protein
MAKSARKKSKRKGKSHDGAMPTAGAALAGVAGGIIAEAIGNLLARQFDDYLNKSGKKKARKLIRKLTSQPQS